MARKITDRELKSLVKKGTAGRYAAGHGLYFRINPNGSSHWVVRYSIFNKRREITLGSYPEISLAKALAEAVTIRTQTKEGIDPLAERKRADTSTYQTVNDLAEDWLKSCEKRLKHANIPRRVYSKDIAPFIGELGIEQVSPIDIRAIITKITESGRPTIANDALMYCKQLFRHGIKLNLLKYNPAEAFNVNDAGGVEKSRSRALSLEEVKQVFITLKENSDQFTRENYLAVALLLALGVRKGELISAKWEEFDTQKNIWNIPEERAKTGTPISVPLPNEAMMWLNELYIRASGSEYVFPNRRASKRFGHISPDTLNAAIQKLFRENKMPVEHFTVHDLRRTCRSLLASLKVPGHVAERCLNHKLKGVEGIYDRYDYMDERRDALMKITRLIAPIINIDDQSKFNNMQTKTISYFS